MVANGDDRLGEGMVLFEWSQPIDHLMLRQDSFSWQGSSDLDARLFLRREKHNKSIFTDILTGELGDEDVSRLLSRFILASGGIKSGRISVISIAYQSDSRERVVQIFDRLVSIFSMALDNLGHGVRESFLDPARGSWNAVIQVE